MANTFAFIIPAYNPDDKLVALVDQIQAQSDNLIFIVDDGSKGTSQYVFEKLNNKFLYKNIIFLKDAINMGKGSSLKKVFEYIYLELPNIKGAVTLDCDGQHSAKDAIRILCELEKSNNGLVLGCRDFNRNIPLRSYIGNNFSRFIFKIVLKKDFKDTQTGLRGLSRNFMKDCLSIKSNRFEFETEQLALAVEKNIPISEVSIETIYIEGNKSSSFRPIVDSFKIYFVLLRYFFAAVLSSLIDLIVFSISILFGLSILNSNIWGRSISLLVNFLLLRNLVFKDKNKSFLKFSVYIGYVYLIGYISALLQVAISNHFDSNLILIKIFVESLLFIINFSFLRTVVFQHK
jgi:putative flippase GtrA